METAATVLGVLASAGLLLAGWLVFVVVQLVVRAGRYRPQRRHARRVPECSCGLAWSGDESAQVVGCAVHDPALRNRP